MDELRERQTHTANHLLKLNTYTISLMVESISAYLHPVPGLLRCCLMSAKLDFDMIKNVRLSKLQRALQYTKYFMQCSCMCGYMLLV